MRPAAIVFLVASMAGCRGPGEPASTNTSSASLPTLAERVEFVQRYVKFCRTYRALDFHIVYRNGGRGMVPSPSEWDIRFVAVAPPEEFASWVPAGTTGVPFADRAWMAAVPGNERAAGITEWYVGARSMVGVDRSTSAIAYRRRTF